MFLSGSTPLHVASQNADAAAVSALVLAGADRFLSDRHRKLPLHYAAESDDTRAAAVCGALCVPSSCPRGPPQVPVLPTAMQPPSPRKQLITAAAAAAVTGVSDPSLSSDTAIGSVSAALSADAAGRLPLQLCVRDDVRTVIRDQAC